MILKKLKQLRCQMLLMNKRNIKLGKTSTFGRGTVLYAPNRMTIGENVYIGKYCSLETNIEIEMCIRDRVMLVFRLPRFWRSIIR